MVSPWAKEMPETYPYKWREKMIEFIGGIRFNTPSWDKSKKEVGVRGVNQKINQLSKLTLKSKEQ